MAFDFWRNYMINIATDRRLVDLDGEPEGITTNQLMVAICFILRTYKSAFNFMALRAKVAESLEMDIGAITIADMQSAVNQLQSKQLVRRTKSFNLIGCPGLGKALRKLLV